LAKYCDVAPGHPDHGPYHDHEYGYPVDDEAALFERLSLEIFQAGLSWLIVLRKRPNFAAAFADFEVASVAAYDKSDVERLLGDPSIIRNRRKIEAVIENARRAAALRSSHGGMASWIAAHHPRNPDEWVKLFRSTFVFTGPEIVREFLLSIGFLRGAHREDCPVFTRIAALRPPWMAAEKGD